MEGDPSTYGYKAEFGLATSSFALDDYQNAVEYARKALAAKPDDNNILEFLAKSRRVIEEARQKDFKAGAQ